MEHANYEYSNWKWCYRPKIIDSGKLGPKIEMRFNLHENWHSQVIFKFLLITSKLRTVKTFKSFFSRVALYPVKYLIRSFLKKKSLTRCRIRLFIFEMWSHNTKICKSFLSNLSEVFFKKKCRNSWSIERGISTADLSIVAPAALL